MNCEKIFSDILPQDRIITQNLDTLYGASTTGTKTQILAALLPLNREEVQKIIHVSNRENLKIHPISTGKNWGYSDGAPHEDGRVLLDLSGLNDIIDYNSAFGVVTVEPGVTQKQLTDFLKRHGDQHIISPTGSSPDASIIGNYLERGFGLAPIIDHSEAVMSLEAIYLDGSLYRSALAREGCDIIDKLYPHDVGPDLKSLFFQNQIGIVTQMTIQLARKPETVMIAVAEVSQSNFSAVVEALRDIRQTHHIPSLSIKIFNALYVLAAAGEIYPEDYKGTAEALPKAVTEQMMKKKALHDFTVIITMSGPRALLKPVMHKVKKTLKPFTQTLRVIDELKYCLAHFLRPLLPKLLRENLQSMATLWGYINGQPSQNVLLMAYWRCGNTPSDLAIDPARDGCGIIWYAPIIPFKIEYIRSFEAMVNDICPQHGINPVFNLTNYKGNFIVGLVAILFDPDTQTGAANACYMHLLAEGKKRGIYPYRLPGFMRKAA